MPVNTAALKTFAPAMRRQLIEAVGRKVDLLLNSQTPDTLSTYAKQIAELREQEAENREQLLERVAYTWFNRLCALRYLDAKGWHPFGCKVLMPAAEDETQPELLKLMRAGSLPAELKPHTNEARLHGLLDGQIPPAVAGADPQGEVYRELILASCRSYHQLLPELFEGLDDASELLLPDDLLSEGSIAGGFRSAISDADCEDVEIIGWLYQFYISEKKDQVIGKVVKSEDIPAATQLFTPNWIVKYMVQNSLGATWLATYPDSPLKGQMEFYIEPAEQTPEVQAQLAVITPESLDPEELTLIDPACGSGHILVEAYDLLKGIYLERGYRQRDIPELILTKNLFGLDICPRAAQLAAFSLLMKGREDDRRLLERGIQLNVMALQDSTGLNVERLAASVDLSVAGISRADVRILAELFTHSTTFGSLIQVPSALAAKLPALSRIVETTSQDLIIARDLQLLPALTRQAATLSRRYDVVVANPPYMGSKYYEATLKEFVGNTYKAGKADLYGAFTLRNIEFAKRHGKVGMITIPNWMFLSSFEELRARISKEAPISSLVHNGRGVWGSDFGSCSYVLGLSNPCGLVGRFLRLFDAQGSVASNDELILRFQENPRFSISGTEFEKIPGSPVAYWLGQKIELFRKYRTIAEERDPQVGLQTSDNGRYVRFWWEVAQENLCIGARSSQDAINSMRKWFPFNKGGEGRRWSANTIAVVNWFNDGEEIKRSIVKKYPYLNGNPDYVVKDRGYYFRPGVIGNKVSIAGFSVAYTAEGFIFSNADMLIPVEEKDQALPYCSFLNSSLAKDLLEGIAPTVNYEKGQIGSLPLPTDVRIQTDFAKRCIKLSECLWDMAELSLNFRGVPALFEEHKLAGYFKSRIDKLKHDNELMAKLEAANDKAVLEAFGIPDEPSSRVNNGDIPCDDLCDHKDLATSLISYATGCMMGRYSLDLPGLVLADSRSSQEEQLSAYAGKVGRSIDDVQFKPDPDAIIPVLDGEWFEDDIVARSREFLAVTFPESSVAENLRFIEEALGKDIRKYFCGEFYKDHLQTYKKRPIYWMVQSPAGPSRGGFACLIYLHCYTKDTLNQVLNNYFRPYLQKLEARLAQLGFDQLSDDLPARERTAARKEAEKITKVLKECQAWEQDALLPLAQQRIELDLDDGVKVNYLKLQDVLAPIPGLATKED